MVAIRNDLDLAGAARQLGEGFGRIELTRLSVAPQVKDRAADARRELEHVRTVLQGVDEARGTRHVPPPGQEQQLAPPALGIEGPGLLRDLRKKILSGQACAAL